MSLNLLNQGNHSLLELLEWNTISTNVASNAYLKSTIEIFNNPPTAFKASKIEKHFDILENIIKKISNHELSDLNGILGRLAQKEVSVNESYGSLIEKLKKSHVFRLNDIGAFYLLVRSAIELNRSEISENVFQVETKNIEKYFYKKVRKYFDELGNFQSSSHPVLGPLYEKLNKFEIEIRKTVDHILTSEKYSNVLQYQEHDVINNRFVIPIKSDAYSAKFGEILSHSESGLTLYVEPAEVARKTEKKIAVINLIEETTYQLSNEYSSYLHDARSEVENCFKLIQEVDYINSKAKFCYEHDFVRPKFTDEKFDIKGIFHPLIKNCVKNDVTLSRNKNGLVISGPNTGGKTIFLKSISLLALFARSGFFVPATNAEIPMFNGIFYFGNDNQSLEHGLSSFSGEVEKYIGLFQELDDRNLILIDEIFNSTSSEEASSLAIGFFEHLNEHSNSKLFISTHHQMLKTLVHQDGIFESAHVGYSADDNKPTYKINLGLPGSSMALNIFDKVSPDKGISDKILSRAKKVIDKKTIMYEELLKEVSQKNAELDILLKENRKINNELKNQRQANDGLYRLEKDKKIAKLESKLQSTYDKAKRMLQQAKSGELSSRQLERKYTDIKGGMPSNEKKKAVTHNFNEIPSEIIKGEQYYSTLFHSIVIVSDINERKKQAVVKNGKLTMHCPLDSLRVVHKGNKKKVEVKVNVIKSARNAKLEYDCRGMRLSEFEIQIDKAITDLLSNEVPYVDIIHGHGDGILKRWLRNQLKTNRDIKGDSPENGNDGITRLELKK